MRSANVGSYRIAGLAIISLLLFGCGGGGGNPPASPPPLGTDASIASLSVSGVVLDPAFSSAVTDYIGIVPFGSHSVDVTATTTDGNASFTINGSNAASVTLATGDNTITIVVTAENGTTTRTYTIVVTRLNLAQEAYIKASNTDAGDRFGLSVTLSGDGNTLAVGAFNESSAATGVNGDQNDNSSPRAGAVYIFTRSTGGVWTQQAYVKASNTDAGDQFGTGVDLSDDGNTLAIGASTESSAATGVNGDQNDNSSPGAGAVYVFTRDNADTWTQQAYIKASNTDPTRTSNDSDLFGFSVTLSGDGNTLAVGALSEDSASTGVNGDQTSEGAIRAGAVYVFNRDSADTWTQQAYVKASNTDAGDQFGLSVTLSGDGNTLAVGAREEDGASTGVNGDQTDNSLGSSGAVYVFTRDTGGVWTQQAYVKASNTDADDRFGTGVDLSDDGSALAIGASNEGSAGAVYVFTRDSVDTWTQQAYVKASNSDPGDSFGISPALSGDGMMLAVGAAAESSSATGVNGDQTDNSLGISGAVYVFSTDSGGAWTQQAYVKASNPAFFGEFGGWWSGVALSNDSSSLAVGGWHDSSAATGVNGDQTDTSSNDAGAVYVFR